MDTEEFELIMQFRKIADEQLRHLAIRQVKQIADMEIKKFHNDLQDRFDANTESDPLDE